MRRQELLDNINYYLGQLAMEVYTANKAGLYNLNVHTESMLIPLWNILLKSNFDNINKVVCNAPAVDLVDYNNRVAIQVTSRIDHAKMIDTLDKLHAHNIDKYIDTVYYYIIGNNKPRFKMANRPASIKAMLIWDNGDLYRAISGLPDIADIEEIHQVLKASIIRETSFSPLYLPQPINDHYSFHFSYRNVPVLGREKETKQLSAFVHDECSIFSWLVITGKGGAGKSRLALESCLSAKEQGWEVGFLDRPQDLTAWSRWQNTLIVIDFFTTKFEDTLDLIKRIVRHTHSVENCKKLRLLLIDRELEEKHLDGLAYNHEVWPFRYDIEKISPAIELPVIHADTAVHLLKSMIEKVDPSFDLPAEEQMVELIEKYDPSRRPVFINFLAIVLLEKKTTDYTIVNNIDLLKYILHREKTKYWNIPGDGYTEQAKWEYENLLACNTIAGSMPEKSILLQLNEWQKNNLLIGPARFSPDQYRRMSFFVKMEDDIHYHGLQPDPVGRFFLLSHLTKLFSGSKNDQEVGREIIRFGWLHKPLYTGLFFAHTFADYLSYTHKDFLKQVLFIEPPAQASLYAWIFQHRFRSVMWENVVKQAFDPQRYSQILQALTATVEDDAAATQRLFDDILFMSVSVTDDKEIRIDFVVEVYKNLGLFLNIVPNREFFLSVYKMAVLKLFRSSREDLDPLYDAFIEHIRRRVDLQDDYSFWFDVFASMCEKKNDKLNVYLASCIDIYLKYPRNQYMAMICADYGSFALKAAVKVFFNSEYTQRWKMVLFYWEILAIIHSQYPDNPDIFLYYTDAILDLTIAYVPASLVLPDSEIAITRSNMDEYVAQLLPNFEKINQSNRNKHKLERKTIMTTKALYASTMNAGKA